MSLPTRPSAVMSDFGTQLQQTLAKEMQEMQDECTLEDETRDSLFKSTRLILKNTAKIQFAVRTGVQGPGVENLINENAKAIDNLLQKILKNPLQRSGHLSQAIQSFTETRMMQYFFNYGKLPTLSELSPCNDDEYIGASLDFAQSLSRYCVNRACDNDINSITICKKILIQLNSKMLEFDFRNGPLRRKYDGLKYALKNVEDITYELSLLDANGNGTTSTSTSTSNNSGIVDEENVGSKRSRKEDIDATVEMNTESITTTTTTTANNDNDNDNDNNEEMSLLPVEDIDAIKVRMDIYDKLREQVIKDCRDVQKLSKQGIFSVHRKNYIQSQKQLDEAKTKVLLILDLIEKNNTPSLRNGSLSNCLEEWAEGILTLHWAINTKIISKEELVICNTSEYIGALSDFTGEIGRMAINEASKRNIIYVKNILQIDVAISSGLQQLNINGKFTKKVDAINSNLRKIEDVVYELSMKEMGGKGNARQEDVPKTAAVNDDD